ncbi:PAS domain-containing sensor histidine kinase, partial [Xanthomonas codiaei]
SDGNGLGLALVREIVRAHGGQVRYAHTDGLTDFIVELPWRAS